MGKDTLRATITADLKRSLRGLFIPPPMCPGASVTLICLQPHQERDGKETVIIT